MELRLIDAEPPARPPLALGIGRALLEGVRGAGTQRGILRIYRPEPTLAFGARDRFLPGFPDAIAAAQAHGFSPVLRSLGGRAAAYHRDSLVIDHLEPSGDFLGGTRERFSEFGEFYAEVLRGEGVDAGVGEIPGEYCPGEFSVHVGGTIKAIGTAQRVVRGGWLFSSSVVVADPDPIRAVLTDVYAALGLDWEPSTGGSISERHPGVTTEGIQAAFTRAYGRRYGLVPSRLTPAEYEAGAAAEDAHTLPRPTPA